MRLAGRARHPAHELSRCEFLRGASENQADTLETVSQELEEALLARFPLRMGRELQGAEEAEDLRVPQSPHRRLRDADHGRAARVDQGNETHPPHGQRRL